MHLKFVQLFSDSLIVLSENVKLLLVVRNGLKELGVSGLPCEEFLDDLLDVREASLSSDLLEGLLDLSIFGHLSVHFGLQKCRPELLSKEILVHFELIGVLVVVCSLISDLLLASVSLDASLKGSFLVVKGFEHRSESVLSLEVILIDQSHELFKTVLSLLSLLLGLSVSITFFQVNFLLVFKAILRFIELDLNRNQISFHSLHHVSVLSLSHHLFVMLFLDLIESLLGPSKASVELIFLVLDVGLIPFSLLEFSLK